MLKQPKRSQTGTYSPQYKTAPALGPGQSSTDYQMYSNAARSVRAGNPIVINPNPQMPPGFMSALAAPNRMGNAQARNQSLPTASAMYTTNPTGAQTAGSPAQSLGQHSSPVFSDRQLQQIQTP